MELVNAMYRGFTLIELTIVMALISILAAIAAPGMGRLGNTMTVRSASQDLYNALNYTRGEAISRVTNVSICPTTNGTSCSSSVTDWNNAWLIYVDQDGDCGVDEVLQTNSIANNNAEITVTAKDSGGTTISPTPGCFSYDWFGRNQDNQSVNFQVCGVTSDGKNIAVSDSGFSAIKETTSC